MEEYGAVLQNQPVDESREFGCRRGSGPTTRAARPAKAPGGIASAPERSPPGRGEVERTRDRHRPEA
jgi:hypothetical protein